MIVPLDPTEGERYTEPAREQDGMDHIYKLTARDEDWINPTTDGVLFLEKDSKCFFDFDEEIDHIYKLTTQDEDWINPTVEGVLCWEKDSE